MQVVASRQTASWLKVVVGVSIALILVQVGLPSQRVHAASGGPSFSLQPAVYDPANPVTRSYFVLNTDPGKTLQSKVRVVNAGSAAGSVDLYGVDATTGQTGGIVYVSPEQAQSQVGNWIKLGVQHVTLAAGQSQEVPFQVIVPASTLPGQHMGGITARNLTTQNASQSGQIRVVVQNLSIVAVQVNVPGTPVEQMTATNIHISEQSGYQTLIVGLTNAGSVILQPAGSLQILDGGGQVTQNFPIKLGSFLPQTSITYPIYIKKQSLSAGNYQAVLQLSYGHGHTLNDTQAFSVSQEQVKPTFNPSPVPPLPANDNSSPMPIWQIILVACAAGVLLLIGGRKTYSLVVASRRKRAHTPKSRTNKAA